MEPPPALKIKIKPVYDGETVTSVDLHPTEPWILASFLYGKVCIWNYQSEKVVYSSKLLNVPVSSAKFIPCKQWFVFGTDDMYIRVYSYNVMTKALKKVRGFKGHRGHIRCVAVHPTRSFVLSSADDRYIKLWDWEIDWTCTQTFKGHTGHVMQVAFNPNNTDTFASASLDNTIKIWNIDSSVPTFTLGTHPGVTRVDYFTGVGGDNPYLITGSNDYTAVVWNYQTKTRVRTLKSHTNNVSAVCFHPELPIIITGSEDGTVRIWHSTTYRLESTLNYDFKRVWAIGYMRGSRRVAIGCDGGIIMVKIGREEPAASMDNGGGVIWAQHNKIQTVDIRSVGSDYVVSDGERLPLPLKELGPCDLYTQSLKHNRNGLFVICGGGKYFISTALEHKNISSGSALEVVWSPDGEYAARESTSSIKIFNKDFKEKKSFQPKFPAECIYGGTLLAMRSNDFICFYDWAECRLIRRINVTVKNLYWADGGDQVAITTITSFYMLKFKRDEVSACLDGAITADDGVKDAFEILYKIDEQVRTGIWVEKCFIYNTSSWRLNYCVGGKVTTMSHLDRPMYLLGYLANQNRVYLIDREFNVIGYTLHLSLVQYKTLVMRGNLEEASQKLLSVPNEQHNNVARFLELQGMIEAASNVATDPDYRFELASQTISKRKMAKDLKRSVWVMDVEGTIDGSPVVRHGTGFLVKGDIPLGEGRELILLTCLHIFYGLDIDFTINVRRLDEDGFRLATIEYGNKGFNLVALRVSDLSGGDGDYGVLARDGSIFAGERLFYVGNPVGYVGSDLVGEACFPCRNDVFRAMGANCDTYPHTLRDITPDFKIMGHIYDIVSIAFAEQDLGKAMYQRKLEASLPIIQIAGLLDREGCSGSPVFNNRGEIVGISFSNWKRYHIAIHVRAIEAFFGLLRVHYFEEIDQLLI